jgi:hypothetical protein
VSDVVPPSLGLSATAAQAAPAGIPGTVANPPPAAAQLPGGAILHGTVIRLDGHNRVLVRTDLGTLVVSSHARLTAQPATAQPATAQPAAAQPAATGQASGPGVPAGLGGAADVLTLGQSLQAVLQSLPAQGAAATGDQGLLGLALVKGGRLKLRVLQVEAPAAPQPDQPRGLPRGDVAAPTGVARSGAGQTIPGLVAGLTGAGEPVVDTALGTLVLGLKTALPSGTRLLLELLSVSPLRSQTMAGDAARSAALAFGWPALDEALELLEKPGGPTAPSPAAASRVPQPGPRLASTILYFLQALSGGDLRGWLGGQAAGTLERAGRGDLLARLNSDLVQLGRLSETAGSEWRFLPIPLFDGTPVQQLRLFLRRRRAAQGGDGAEDGDGATRFILDVELSRIGDMQLDGLVRDRRFDLILRTRHPLSDKMRRDIAEIFGDANGAAGHQGQISFQASGDWSFIPLESSGEAGAGLLA